MFIILGAAGQIGSVVVQALRGQNLPVLAVLHSASKAADIEALGAEAVVADIADPAALKAVFARGTRAFLLNPPGDPGSDSSAAELETGRSIVAALQGSGLGKVVVASTYGAQPGDAIGDLATLYALEQGALDSGIPTAINRGAYYFSNLAMLVDAAREGIVPTAFPADFVLPMVAPEDLGKAAVKRLLSDVDDVGVQYVEGPARYSFADVAETFGRLLNRRVEVVTTPRSEWVESYRNVGFSDVSSRSFAGMTAATLDRPDLPQHPWRGSVSLEHYLRKLLS